MYKSSTLKKFAQHLNTEFKQGLELKSIILNFSDEESKHGCRCKCKYCNWKTNPLAQRKIYPDFKLSDEYLEGHTGVVTISGGGDPLYKFEKNKKEVFQLLDYLYKKKFIPRIITRERENFFKLQDEGYPLVLGSFSINSFDQMKYRDDNIEYSIVLTPENIKEILKSKFKVLENQPIIFREPLNVNYKISSACKHMLTYYKKAEFSTERLCYEAEYLVGDKILKGCDIFD